MTVSTPNIQSPQAAPTLTRRDYLCVSLIGVSFALFAIPILRNLKLSFISLDFTTFILLVAFFLIFSNLALWIAGQLGRRLPVFLQIAKFAAVGAFNTFLDWGVVNLLIALTAISAGIWFSVFAGVGFVVANVGSYFWNKHWTFSSGAKEATGSIIPFFLVSLVGFGLKVGVASLVVNGIVRMGDLSGEQWANVGNVFGTVFALIWNFIGYKFFVFKK